MRFQYSLILTHPGGCYRLRKKKKKRKSTSRKKKFEKKEEKEKKFLILKDPEKERSNIKKKKFVQSEVYEGTPWNVILYTEINTKEKKGERKRSFDSLDIMYTYTYIHIHTHVIFYVFEETNRFDNFTAISKKQTMFLLSRVATLKANLRGRSSWLSEDTSVMFLARTLVLIG